MFAVHVCLVFAIDVTDTKHKGVEITMTPSRWMLILSVVNDSWVDVNQTLHDKNVKTDLALKLLSGRVSLLFSFWLLNRHQPLSSVATILVILIR